MKNSYLIFPLVLLSIIFIMLGACSSGKGNYLSATYTSNEIKATSNKIDKVFAMLTGHFTNKNQADTTNLPIYREQEIISLPIWPKRGGEYWFFMGWFQANYTEKPLAMGIFELKKYSRDTFSLVFYDIPNEEQYTNDWKKKDLFQDLDPKDLIHQNGCSYLVVKRENDLYEILPSGNPCKKHFMGPMHYFDFAAYISPDTHNHFHSFFDQDQNLIMTYPKPIGLSYDRLDKDKPKYNF